MHTTFSSLSHFPLYSLPPTQNVVVSVQIAWKNIDKPKTLANKATLKVTNYALLDQHL